MTSIDVNFKNISSQVALQMADMLAEMDEVEAVQRSDADDDRFGAAEASFVLSLVLSGGLTLQFVAGVAYRLRQRFRPFLILDFNADDPKISVIDGVPGMRGEVVVRTRDGEDVKLEGFDSQSAIVSGIQKAVGQQG